MADCDYDALLEEATCLDTKTSERNLIVLQTALLFEIAGIDLNADTIQELLDESACLPSSMQVLTRLQVQLLCNIVSAL